LSLLAWLACSASQALASNTATLSINTSTVVNTFVPFNVFGANVMFWNGETAFNTIQPKVQAAGNWLIRYPGGSSSDDFHWNGKGSFDSQSHWVPDDTNYSVSWVGNELYRGTTSSYGVASNLTDGLTTTAWLSNADTDAPNAQWVYVDLGSSRSANSMTITWATPYATQFHVQYWTGSSSYPTPYMYSSSLWADTSSGTLSGSGGVQTVSFSAVTSEWFRVLCTASSVSPAQYSIAEITLSSGGTQLTKNVATITNGVADQSQAVASSTDPACTLQSPLSLDFESFMSSLAQYPSGATPLITINVGTGTPQEAAAWVHYANIVRHFNITHWQIGNEMDGNWETGGPLSAKDYARRYIEYYQAMKAVDPSITIAGPVAGGPTDSSDDEDNKTYIQGFVDRLAADPGGNKAAYAEAIDFHWYPEWNSTNAAANLASPQLWSQYAGSGLASSGAGYPTATGLPAMLVNHPNPSTVPVWLTEYNLGAGNCHACVTLANGMWLASWLGEFIKAFGSRGSANIWDVLEGGDAATSPTGSSLGYLNGNSDAFMYQERAHYWAMRMMATEWAVAGDTSSHSLVQATSSLGLLNVYADKRPDGLLSLMVVNTDPSNTTTATLNFTGFTPAASAMRYTFNDSNYQWLTTTGTPYHASPDLPPTQGTETGIASGYSHAFGPYSITVLQFNDGSLPLPSPSSTPTPQPSLTPTPTYGPTVLIDDFEDVSRNGPPPARFNLWGGNWNISDQAGVTSTATYLAPGAHGSLHSVSWTTQCPSGDWADLSTTLGSTFDATGNGFIGLQFWAYGDGNTYRFEIETQNITDYDYYGINIAPPANTWQYYQVPFNTMTRQSWGTQSPAPVTVTAGHDLIGLQFAIQNNPTLFNLRLDDVGFYQASAILTPTPSSTFTATKTISPTPSLSPTFTISQTPSTSPSFTLSFTASPTASISPTCSATPTQTQTPTASPTATLSTTVAPSSSGLRIIRSQLAQSPLTQHGPATLYVNLSAQAQALHLRVYTQGYTCVGEYVLSGAGRGWSSVSIPEAALSRNGLYFGRLWAEGAGGKASPAQSIVFFVAR
jgi:hypothetical protein